MAADVEFIDNQVLIRIPKAILILTKQEFFQALKRGKTYKRQQALKARMEDTKA
jgi:hypothetical protein